MIGPAAEPSSPGAATGGRWTRRRCLIAAVAAVAAALLGARAFKPYTGVAPHIDSGVYLGVAEHLLHGRVLYREVWDHKPPLVHTLDAIALAAGDHTVNAVRTMEIGFAALAAVVMLAVGILAFENLGIAALASLLFVVHFYHPNVMRGNQPEEYGSILTVAAIALCLAALVARPRLTRFLGAGSGLLFGLACLSKETFLLGVLPWLAVLLWPWTERRVAVRRAMWFVGGLLAPLLAFVAYLAWNRAIGDWLEVVRFNLSYVRYDPTNASNPGVFGLLADGIQRGYQLVFAVSPATAIAALIGVAGAASSSFRRRTHSLPVVLVAFFVLDLAAVSLARRYGYYYLQLVPAYVLLAACGVAFVAFLVRARRGLAAAVVAVAALVVAASSPGEAARFARGVSQPRATFHGNDALAAFIDANTAPGDPIWNLVRSDSAIYADARRLSPTRFIYIAVNLFRDLPDPDDARREIREALEANPPNVVLFDGDVSWLEKAGIGAWFRSNYRPGPVATVFLRASTGPPGDGPR